MRKKTFLTLLALGTVTLAARGQDRVKALPARDALGVPSFPISLPADFAGAKFGVPIAVDLETGEAPPVAKLGSPNSEFPSPLPNAPAQGIQPVTQWVPPVLTLQAFVPNAPAAVGAFPSAQYVEQPVIRSDVTFDPRWAPTGRSERFWARAEYGLWFLQGRRLPPLVTSSPPGTLLANAGVLGNAANGVLIGNERVNDDARSGGRYTIGAWLNEQQTWGLEAGYWLIDSQSQRWSASSAARSSPGPSPSPRRARQRRSAFPFPGWAPAASPWPPIPIL